MCTKKTSSFKAIGIAHFVQQTKGQQSCDNLGCSKQQIVLHFSLALIGGNVEMYCVSYRWLNGELYTNEKLIPWLFIQRSFILFLNIATIFTKNKYVFFYKHL